MRNRRCSRILVGPAKFKISLRLVSTLATCVLWLSCSAYAQNVTYLYDSLGRLVGVIDQNGSAAQYNYDSVGNILSISRFTSSQVSIIQFSPQSGPVGTVVTISGTGFSSTASQNSVTFNGVLASVASATANQIVVSVPAGATTGPITVSSPNGSATATINFIVTTSNGQPIVTGFSPTSGVPGTAVTIAGENFLPSIPNNLVAFNSTGAFASSATTSQLTTVVPASAGSGRISVRTPFGQGVSTQDFYIPFGSHSAGDIGFTARMSFGQTENVSLAASKIALLLFDATAGQAASLQLSATTFPSCMMYMFGPTGAQLASAGCASANSVISSTGLPVTGSYTIGIDPGTSTGSLTVGLTSDIGQSITANGSSVQLALSHGQSGKLTFSGLAGQLATVQVSANSAGAVPVSLLDPSSVALTSVTSSLTSFFLPAAILPSTGTYTVAFGPAPQSGNISVALTVAPAATSPPARPSLSILDPGNALSAKLAGLFVMNEGSGTTDRNLVNGNVATFSGTTLPSWGTDPSVIFGGGGSLASYLDAGVDRAFDQIPVSQVTVLAKVYVNSVAAGGIAEKNDGGSTTGFAFGIDSGGALHLSFATSGANMRVATTSGAITAGRWIQVAFTWDGTSGIASAASAHLFINGIEQPKALSIDGSVTLGYVNATNKPFRIGNASFEVQGSLNGKIAYLAVYKGRILAPTELSQFDSDFPVDVSDANQPITPNASPANATTTSPGQRAVFSFSATTGQLATVQFSNNSIGSLTATLLKPDLTPLISTTSSAGSFSLPMQWLPASGEYRVYIQPTGSTSGGITVGLTLANAPLRPTGSIVDPSNPLSADLVGLFLMNEGSGTSDQNLADGQMATLSGTSVPTWNTADPSIVFNGDASLGSYLNAGTDLAFDQLPVSKMTLVGKMYVNTLASGGGLAEKNDGGSSAGFEFGWDNTGALVFGLGMPGTNMRAATMSGTIQAGQWVQVAVTWDGTSGTAAAANVHIFLNGVEQNKTSTTDGTGTLGYANATNRPFRIGNASFGTPGSLNGKLAYLAVYKGRILTPTEINQLDMQLPIH